MSVVVKIIAGARTVADLARWEVAEVVMARPPRSHRSTTDEIAALAEGNPRDLDRLRGWLASAHAIEREMCSLEDRLDHLDLTPSDRTYYEERLAAAKVDCAEIEAARKRLDEIARDVGLVLWDGRLCRPERVSGRYALTQDNVILEHLGRRGALDYYEDIDTYVHDSVPATWEKLTGEVLP